MAELDPSILLQGRPLQVPNPLQLATQGLSLADLANRNQLMQYQVQQQADIPAAMQAIQGVSDPEQQAQILMRDHPRASQVLVPMIRDLAYKQAQTQQALAEAAAKNADANAKAYQTIGNAATYEAANPNPLSVSHVVSAARFYGKDQQLPPLPDPNDPDAQSQWLKAVAGGSMTGEQQAKAALDTINAKLAPELARYKGQEAAAATSQATSAASRAQTEAANVYAPKVGISPALQPYVEQRFLPGTTIPSPAIYTPGNTAPSAQPQPMPGPTQPQQPGLALQPGLTPGQQALAASDFARTGGAVSPYADQVSRAFGGAGTIVAPTAPAPGTPGGALATPGAANAQGIADYKVAPPAGGRTTPLGMMQMDQVDAINKARGSPAYDATLYQAKLDNAKAFAEGKPADQVQAGNIALSHTELLRQLGQALQNPSQIQVVNAIYNRLAQESGSAVPTNFNAAAQIVAKEVAKAYVPGGGGEGEREGIANTLSNAQSYPQIAGTLDTYQALMGGAMRGMKTRYDASNDPLKTGQSDFNKFLAPETQAVMSRPQAAPASAPATAAGKRTSAKLPDPTTLNEGDVVTNNATGKRLIVRNGRYENL